MDIHKKERKMSDDQEARALQAPAHVAENQAADAEMERVEAILGEMRAHKDQYE